MCPAATLRDAASCSCWLMTLGPFIHNLLMSVESKVVGKRSVVAIALQQPATDQHQGRPCRHHRQTGPSLRRWAHYAGKTTFSSFTMHVVEQQHQLSSRTVRRSCATVTWSHHGGSWSDSELTHKSVLNAELGNQGFQGVPCNTHGSHAGE